MKFSESENRTGSVCIDSLEVSTLDGNEVVAGDGSLAAFGSESDLSPRSEPPDLVALGFDLEMKTLSFVGMTFVNSCNSLTNLDNGASLELVAEPMRVGAFDGCSAK